MRVGWVVGGFVVCAITACSGGSTRSASPGTSGDATTTALGGSTATGAPSTTGGSTATGGPSTAGADAPNLPVTATVRQSLLEAGAAHHRLAASDYVGLRPNETYYAYDTRTSTYWAGAALNPSPSSQQAQVSSQDDGSYLLFRMPSGGAWTVFDDGLGGIGGTPCPVTVPPGVLAAWGWSPGACQPPHR